MGILTSVGLIPDSHAECPISRRIWGAQRRIMFRKQQNMRCTLRHWIWLLLAFPLAAPAQETEPSLHMSVNEVMLDVVVRDKKAHIIGDLRPEEVKVFEDGVPQTLRHFE